MVPISPVVEVLALDGAGIPISNMTISVTSATSLVRGFYPFLPADLVAAYNGEAVSCTLWAWHYFSRAGTP